MHSSKSKSSRSLTLSSCKIGVVINQTNLQIVCEDGHGFRQDQPLSTRRETLVSRGARILHVQWQINEPMENTESMIKITCSQFFSHRSFLQLHYLYDLCEFDRQSICLRNTVSRVST